MQSMVLRSCNTLFGVALSYRAAAEGLEITLMERLIPRFPDHVQMLTVQYRMNEQIMRWASDELYSGLLTAHHSVAKHLLKDLPVRITTMFSITQWQQ